MSGCTNIEHLYFEGTAVTGVQLPNGGILKTLHLPETVTNLTIRNQMGITDFVIGGYDNISTLRLENVSEVFDLWEILHSIPVGARVRVTGLRRSFEDAADILAFYDLLDTMRGLDENGNNTDKAQISGIFTIAELTNDELAEMLWFADKTKTLDYAPKEDEMVLTVHRWFANKSCPGDWLYSRLGDLATKVTAALGSAPTEADPAPEPAKAELYRVRKTWSDAKSQKGAYKILSNAKKCADANPGYSVFDSKGTLVYPENYRVHTVVHGDTLWKIAAQYLGDGSRYKEIISLNGLSSNVINSGQKLKIPN